MQSIQVLSLVLPALQKHRYVHCAIAAAVLNMTAALCFLLGY